MRYIYAARLDAHRDTVTVSFRDFPEAITEGRDRNEAIAEAVECLDTALLFRLKEGTAVPSPSRTRPGETRAEGIGRARPSAPGFPDAS